MHGYRRKDRNEVAERKEDDLFDGLSNLRADAVPWEERGANQIVVGPRGRGEFAIENPRELGAKDSSDDLRSHNSFVRLFPATSVL